MATRSLVYRLSKFDRITIEGVQHRALEQDSSGYIFDRLDGVLSFPVSYSHERINAMLEVGTMTVDRDWHTVEAARVRNHIGETLASDLPTDVAEDVLWMFDWCTTLLIRRNSSKANSLSDKRLAQLIPEMTVEINTKLEERRTTNKRCGQDITGRYPPSPSQLRRWFKRFRRGGYRLMALCPCRKRCGNRLPRFDSESLAFAKIYVDSHACTNKPTKAQVYRNYLDDLNKLNTERVAAGFTKLATLSQRSFDARVDAIDPYLSTYAREGEAAARRKFGVNIGGLNVERPLERVEMDEWRVSLQTILVDAGVWETMSPKERATVERTRVWVSAAIDCATRCILALRFMTSAPSTASAISTIEMIISDKTRIGRTAGASTPWDQGGIFEQIVMDNGSAFVAEATQLAIRSIGAAPVYPPAGVPSLRGTIESLFSNFQRHFVKYFSGQTFSNPVDKGDYDAEGNACLTVEELNRTLVRYVVDAYHNSPHHGLAGQTPRQAWDTLTNRHGVLPPMHPRQRRHIFGIPFERRICADGIRIMGLHYQSPELQLLRRKVRQIPVLVRVDRYDLSEISVQTPEGWMSIPFILEGVNLTGVSLTHWIEVTKYIERVNQRGAEVSANIVTTALDATRDIAKMGADRAELSNPVMTPELMDRAERKISISFKFRRAEIPTDDFLDVPETSCRQVEIQDQPTPIVPAQYGDDLDGWAVED